MTYFFLKEKVSKKNFNLAAYCLLDPTLAPGNERKPRTKGSSLVFFLKEKVSKKNFNPAAYCLLDLAYAPGNERKPRMGKTSGIEKGAYT